MFATCVGGLLPCFAQGHSSDVCIVAQIYFIYYMKTVIPTDHKPKGGNTTNLNISFSMENEERKNELLR